MSSGDPIRLREGGSSFLKKALESARSDVPSEDRAQALESKILPLLLPPIPPAPPPLGAGAAGAVKAGTAALGAKAGLGFAKITMLAIAAAAVLAGAGVGAIVVSTSSSAPPAPSGVVSAPVVSSSPVVAPEPSLALVPLPQVSAAPSIAPKPIVKPSASVEEADPALEPALLRQAQDALRSNPSEALAKTQEHARKYPRGLLVQEREVIAIEALVKMGRKPEAEARAARFEKSFPGSTHARRIDALLGK